MSIPSSSLLTPCVDGSHRRRVTLIAIQVVAVSTGALPVFWLARRHLESGGGGGDLAVGLPRVPVGGPGRRSTRSTP